MNSPETAGKNMYVNNRRRRKKNFIAMKTSAFCNRLKKVTCDKIGNTYHIKLKRQFLRTSGSEEAMFWEIQFFLLLISLFLQVKVEAHNPFRSIVEYIQICVCVYIYLYIFMYICMYSQLCHGMVREKM